MGSGFGPEGTHDESVLLVSLLPLASPGHAHPSQINISQPYVAASAMTILYNFVGTLHTVSVVMLRW
jgi:hypothetical protein